VLYNNFFTSVTSHIAELPPLPLSHFVTLHLTPPSPFMRDIFFEWPLAREFQTVGAVQRKARSQQLVTTKTEC